MVWLLPSLQGNCNDFLGAAGPDRWDVSLLGYLHLSRVMGTFVAAVYPVCPTPSRAHALGRARPRALSPPAHTSAFARTRANFRAFCRLSLCFAVGGHFGPKITQDGAKLAPRGPNMAQNGPKGACLGA